MGSGPQLTASDWSMVASDIHHWNLLSFWDTQGLRPWEGKSM